MNNSCRGEIDGYSADAFNELVTLRGSDMQTKLRVNQKKWTRTEKREIYRKREDEKHRLGSVAAVQKKEEKKNLSQP